jgi:hypothetical protein
MITPILDQGCRELSRTAAGDHHIRSLKNMRANILAHVYFGLLSAQVKRREEMTIECDCWLHCVAVGSSVYRADGSNCNFLSFVA